MGNYLEPDKLNWHNALEAISEFGIDFFNRAWENTVRGITYTAGSVLISPFVLREFRKDLEQYRKNPDSVIGSTRTQKAITALGFGLGVLGGLYGNRHTLQKFT